MKCRFAVKAVTIEEPGTAERRYRRPLTQQIIHNSKTKKSTRSALKDNEKKMTFFFTF